MVIQRDNSLQDSGSRNRRGWADILTTLTEFYGHTHAKLGYHAPTAAELELCISHLDRIDVADDLRGLRDSYHINDSDRRAYQERILAQEWRTLQRHTGGAAFALNVGGGRMDLNNLLIEELGLSACTTIDPENSEVGSVADLSDISIPTSAQRTSTVAICRFVLHHIAADEQPEFFDRLASLASIVYLVEDVPDRLVRSAANCEICRSIDDVWVSLDNRARFDLIRLNDFWSNRIAYGRRRWDQCYSFRTVRDWTAMAKMYHLEPRWSDKKGFDHQRLHGVPSASIVFCDATA